jgi:hypothetical protein
VDIDFGRQSRKGLDELVGNTSNINCFVEEQGPDGKGPIPVYADPGLTRWDSGSFTGAARGLQENGDVALYAFLGNQAVKFTPSGSGSSIGGLIGSGKVYTSINQAANPQISIVTADNQYFILETATDTLAISADGDLPPVNSTDFLNGYTIFSSAEGGEIWHSQPNDAGNINALSFATAESDADNLVRVKAHKGFLFALGTRSLEIWRDVGTTPFAFQPEDADIDIGCAAGHSVVEVADGLAWVDHFNNVRLLKGGQPGIISTHSIVEDIESLTDAERAQIEGWRTWYRGHEFYELKSAQWSRIYDVTTGVWHNGESLGYNRRTRQRHVLFNNRNILGNELDGKLDYIDKDSFTERGTEYVVTAISRPYHAFPNQLSCSSVELDMITGVGNADIADPQVMFDVSRNGGKTWGAQRTRSLGTIGNYSQKVRFNNLGKADEKGFVFRISSSSAVTRGIIRVSGEFEELEA